jgi:HSP20 family molecular chaperone IbpA
MQVVPHGRWSASPQHGGNAAAPALTVAIHQGVVHVEADLPGMNLQDIRVSVAEGTLTVRGLHCMYGVIERVVNLPRHVRAEAMRVRRERNQLEIDLPVETEAPNGA